MGARGRTARRVMKASNSLRRLELSWSRTVEAKTVLPNTPRIDEKCMFAVGCCSVAVSGWFLERWRRCQICTYCVVGQSFMTTRTRVYVCLWFNGRVDAVRSNVACSVIFVNGVSPDLLMMVLVSICAFRYLKSTPANRHAAV